MTLLTDTYKIQHCRGELGRGHVHRCPRSWLIRVRKLVRDTDPNLAAACAIALDVHRSGSTANPRLREMRKLAKEAS